MTARAAALATAMRRAGLGCKGNAADLESFLALIDPDGAPDLVDEELVQEVVDWLVGLHVETRARETAEAFIAHLSRATR